MSVQAERLTLWHYQPYKQKWRPASYGWGALSAREKMIAVMIASGMTRGEIMKELKISSHTASCYRERVKAKLLVKDSVTLTHFLLSRGLIQNQFASEPNG